MFEIFKNVINKGLYDLRDMLDKIDEKYIENRLSKEEKLQLEEMARTNAKKGSKVTFFNDKYECQMDGCVWSPIEYPAAWKKVTE